VVGQLEKSEIRTIMRGGHGKLIPTPPGDIEFDAVFKIEVHLPKGVTTGPPVVVRVSLTPRFDESYLPYLPEGVYQ
jgi:hypothetical protein